MIENASFLAVLQRALDERGMKAYRLALNSRVSAVTICKLRNYAKYRRKATEPQVLRMFVGVVVRESKRREEILDLVEEELEFLRSIGFLTAGRGVTLDELAASANIGEERLGQALEGVRPVTEAIRLRIAIQLLCTPDEVSIANVFLQAAGFYTMGSPPAWKKSA
jgi:predicted transcriptional regulator